VQDYLTRMRSLPTLLIQQLHQDGLVYADEQGRVVFLRRDWDGNVTGADVWQIGSGESLAIGAGRSEGCFHTLIGSEDRNKVERVVLVSGAIEGLSYQVLHPSEERTMVVAIDRVGDLPWERLRTVDRVAIALNRDARGNEMAQWLLEELPKAERLPPRLGNWNEDLQQRMKEIQQQFQQRQQERGKTKRDDQR
jgi:hypothetical protein